MKTLYEKRPILLCALIIVIFLMTSVVSDSTFAVFLLDGSYDGFFLLYIFTAVVRVLLAIALIAIMRRLMLAPDAFQTKEFFKGMALGWYCLVYAAGAFIFYVVPASSELQLVFNVLQIIIILGHTFSIGLFEEVLLRGFVLNVLVKKDSSPTGIQKACILSSLMFGLFHLLNFVGGADVPSTLVQVCYATFTGLLFAAIYVRTRTLWVPIILHMLINFSAMVLPALVQKQVLVEMMQVETAPGMAEVIIPLLFSIPSAIIAAYMLRKSKLQAQAEAIAV